MDNQIILAIIVLCITMIWLKSFVKIAAFIVVMAVLYFVLKDSNISLFGDGDWTDLLSQGREIKTKVESGWKEWQTKQTQQSQQTQPLEIKPSDDENGCYSGKRIFAGGNSVYWEEEMDTNIIPFEACYEGCIYEVLANHEFKSDENGRMYRLGTWVSTGESCCPTGEIWVDAEQMCCPPDTLCIRVTGSLE